MTFIDNKLIGNDFLVLVITLSPFYLLIKCTFNIPHGNKVVFQIPP
jgi:hypothetical protein